MADIKKIMENSTNAKRYNATGDQLKNTTSLTEFLIKHPWQTRGISMDTKDDDRLLKYNVTKVDIPLKDADVSSVGEGAYIITDSEGRDIGVYKFNEKGQPVFELSPEIKKRNEKIIEVFDKKAKEILRKEYDVKTLEEVVAKLAKGEKLTLDTYEEAKEVKDEYDRENGTEKTREEGSSEGELEEEREEKEAEEQEVASKEDNERPEVQKLRAEGKKIKQVLVVKCPECVDKEMPNGINNIDPNGGEIVMVLTSSGADASRVSDDLYMFQKGAEIPNVRKDQEQLEEAMKANRGKNAVVELNDSGQPLVYDEIKEEMYALEANIDYIKNNRDCYQTPEDLENAINSAKNKSAEAIGKKIGVRALEENSHIVEEEMEKTTEKVMTSSTSDGEEEGDETERNDSISRFLGTNANS